MIILAVHLDKQCVKIEAYFCKRLAQCFQVANLEHASSVFGHEDQVGVEIENAVSSSSYFA